MKAKVFLSIGLLAVVTDYFAWTRMIAAAGYQARHDAWGIVYLISGGALALSFAVALYFLFVHRFATKQWGKPVGVLLALMTMCCLSLVALYWPWFLTKY
jgi:hypothetical protein